MVTLKGQELHRVARPLLSDLFQPPSATAIRRAPDPREALCLFKARLVGRRHPGHDDLSDSPAAVFALKSIVSQPRFLGLVPQFHAYLLKTGLFSGVHVASSLLNGYASVSLNDARRLFDETPEINVVVENTMLACFSRCGELTAARSLFNGMQEKDVVTWSTMIDAYMEKGYRINGFALFHEMMEAGGVDPDELMLVTLLSGCTCTGSLRRIGRSIHAYAVRNGLQISVQLATSFIDMYAKSGCLKCAFHIFERLQHRNVMHWTAMICGLAVNGHGEEAIAFFEEMRKVSVRPNEITFTGVLNACCIAGLVEEGKRYYLGMTEEFGLEPGIQHYGCMVDLLAKAGKLEDAYEIITSMKVEPNIIIWTSFLSACKKHRNFGLAEMGLEKVLRMPIAEENGGVYVLISDLYALGGKWNEMERVRKFMDEKSVKKHRGSSFVEETERGTSLGA